VFPVLVDLGPVEVPTYGLLMAAAFLLALRLGQTLAQRDGIDGEKIVTLWVWLLLGGLAGAKLTLYIVQWRHYLEDPADLLRSWRSAGVYYGGFLAAAIAGAAYARRAGLPLGRAADAAVPAVALGQSIGRLGCLAAGCCWGRPADVPWAITFTDPDAHRITGVPLGIALHPTQVYLSLGALALCGVLLWLWRLRRRRGWPAGLVFWAYLGLYSAGRFFLERFRGDPRGMIGPLSTSQALGLVGLAAAIAGAVFVWRARGR
jgi:phosphatidylglycerol:prolipoprotein diacylglycerol transferase